MEQFSEMPAVTEQHAHPASFYSSDLWARLEFLRFLLEQANAQLALSAEQVRPHTYTHTHSLTHRWTDTHRETHRRLWLFRGREMRSRVWVGDGVTKGCCAACAMLAEADGAVCR